MKGLIFAAIVAFACALTVARAGATARAQETPRTDTVVTVEAPPQARQGAPVHIVARLSTVDGAPIADEELSVNAGDVHGRARTDAAGRATIALAGDIPPGELALTVSFAGSVSRQLSPSTSEVVTMAIASRDGLTLTIEPLGVVEFGGHPNIVVHAMSADGQPQAGIGVDVLMNGEKIGRLQTDETGAGRVALRRDLPTGSYTIMAYFKGSTARGIAEAQVTSQFSIAPGTIRVQTVPALPSVRFALTQYAQDGVVAATQSVRTDGAGLVSFTISEPGGYVLEALPVRDLDESRGMRAEFTRWSDDSFSTARLLYVNKNVDLEAGYDVTAIVGHS